AVELLRFFAMSQTSFAALTVFCIHPRNLLEARMIITTYNQHVRLLSSEPFGWFAPPKSTRATGADIVYGIIAYGPGQRDCTDLPVAFGRRHIQPAAFSSVLKITP